MKETEISIKGLLFYLLRHWKSIVIAMLVGGLAVSGLQMIRSMKSAQNVMTVAEREVSLSSSEKAYVESVYNYLNELRESNNELRDSLIMELDYQNILKTELVYMLSVDDSESMGGLEQAYTFFMTGWEFVGYISNETGISDSDIADIVHVSIEKSGELSSDTSIKIAIVSDKKTQVDEISNAVDSFINEKRNALLQNGFEHALTLIGNNTYKGSDLSILDCQMQYLKEIQSRTKAILDIENAIIGPQGAYYESLVNGSESTLDDYAEPAKGTNIMFSVKHLALGMILGLFLMCGTFFLIYMFANKLGEDDDVEALFGTYLIGTVTGKDYGKAVYKLQHLGKRSFDFDESIKLISTKIKMTAQKEGVSVIGLLGCGIKKYNEKAASELITALKNSGIDAVLIDEPIYDPSSIEKLMGVERVVLLEKAGITYRTEIWKEIEMIKNLGINLDGLVISEQ